MGFFQGHLMVRVGFRVKFGPRYGAAGTACLDFGEEATRNPKSQTGDETGTLAHRPHTTNTKLYTANLTLSTLGPKPYKLNPEPPQKPGVIKCNFLHLLVVR